MVAVGEEMRLWHLTIGVILSFAFALQLGASALLSGRWRPQSRGGVPLAPPNRGERNE
jgi:hypothetical protein